MAHEVESMFSVKERPWHGLGKIVQEAPTAEKAIQLADLDWEVGLKSIYSKVGNQTITIPDKKAIIRKTDNEVFGIAGKTFKPLQNKEAFSFFDPFIENGLATFETAGSLKGGKIIFILAKLNLDDSEIVKGDRIEKYLLLSNAHDNTQAVRVGFTQIRVVCNNILTMAHNPCNSKLIRVKHSSKVLENLDRLQNAVDCANHQFIATTEQYKQMANTNINSNDLALYVKQVFSWANIEKMVEDEEERERVEIEKERARLIERVEEYFDLEPQHKLWNMYNAVNSYLNHERGRTLDTRYASMWFGMNRQLDRRALLIANEMYK